ncbi:Neutral ceramidase-like Protein [Tribolium castaneum]|uniref:Neutral ceramidase n=1 Tax=Tribolium castaneum TaxID=7070 RepID=D6X3Y6_TRICA|nr:Neutral ceramidase-like Protein [Tribolium castaneum]
MCHYFFPLKHVFRNTDCLCYGGGVAIWRSSGRGGDSKVIGVASGGKKFKLEIELFHQEDTFEVTGPVKFIHQYVDMLNEKATITLANGTQQEIRGCPPAMGYSFAGDTTDGPGEFDFAQGTTTDNPF